MHESSDNAIALISARLNQKFSGVSGAIRFEYWPKGGYLLQNHCAKRNLLLCQVISATHAASYSFFDSAFIFFI